MTGTKIKEAMLRASLALTLELSSVTQSTVKLQAGTRLQCRLVTGSVGCVTNNVAEIAGMRLGLELLESFISGCLTLD